MIRESGETMGRSRIGKDKWMIAATVGFLAQSASGCHSGTYNYGSGSHDATVDSGFAGGEVASGDGATPDATCTKCSDATVIRPPCRPGGDDALADANVGQLVFAVQSIRMGMDVDRPNDWRTIGYDLDCQATGDKGKPTTCTVANTVDPVVALDGDYGIDNSFAKNVGGMMRSIVVADAGTPNPERLANDQLLRGDWGLLLTVDNFSGLQTDPFVAVSLLASEGTVDGDGGRIQAHWDAASPDVWSIEQESDGGIGQVMDPFGYVVDDVVVAHLPPWVLTLPIKWPAPGIQAQIRIQLADAVVTFRLKRENDVITGISGGTLAGRWKGVDAVDAFNEFFPQVGLCPPVDAIAMGSIKASFDIMYSNQPGSSSATTLPACDALSMGVAFTGQVAQLGQPLPSSYRQILHCPEDGGG
jgi:hypothetical protein